MRLNSMLRDITSPEKAFEVMAGELKRICKSDYAAILLVEEGSSILKMAGSAITGPPQNLRLPVISVDEQFRSRAVQRDLSVAMRFDQVGDIPGVAQAIAGALGIQSALISPLITRGEFAGYLAVANKEGSPPFPPDSDRTLAILANYFAVVVDSVKSTTELRRAKSDTDRLLALAPIAMFTCDAKGILVSINKQMLRILGKNREDELIGTSAFEQPVFIKSGLEALISQGMEGHEGERADVHVVPSSEKAFYLHAKVMPIKSDKGEVERVLLVAMDVTSKVRLQNQLERSYEKMTQTYQELERVTKMKSQFIDVVSHELRTPLTVMRGYIDLIESEYSAKLEPKFASRLSIIKTNTDKLYSLVESMLDVSRLEKGSMQIHPEPIKVDTILEDIVLARTKDAEEKKQVISLEVDGKLPLINADRRRIKDVFNNLVDNAIKYTQEGGRIQVGARDEGKIIHAWVKDNGVGIPLENLGKIFDRFLIVTSNDLSHQVDRLGLGLPISKGIVEAHGGKLWVESQVGKGSVFHVDLPKESPK
ncbi:MAG TPA: ATP-binding protein [Thermoplasmata archaeon]|nr:ATP-binding protein [Thermoplasmata archaeon]